MLNLTIHFTVYTITEQRKKINNKIIVEVEINVTTEDIEVEDNFMVIHWVNGILEVPTMGKDVSSHLINMGIHLNVTSLNLFYTFPKCVHIKKINKDDQNQSKIDDQQSKNDVKSGHVHITLLNTDDHSLSRLDGETFGVAAIDNGCTKIVVGKVWLEEYVKMLSESDKNLLNIYQLKNYSGLEVERRFWLARKFYFLL